MAFSSGDGAGMRQVPGDLMRSLPDGCAPDLIFDPVENRLTDVGLEASGAAHLDTIESDERA
jgi:hypothetical protein